MGVPGTEEERRLREEVHEVCEQIWGKFNTPMCQYRLMYRWLSHNTKSKHISRMNRKELIRTLGKLHTLIDKKKKRS